MDKLREAKAQRAKCLAEAEALLYDAEGNARDLNDGDRETIDERVIRMQQLDDEIERMGADEERFKSVVLAKSRIRDAQTPTQVEEPGLQVDAETRIIPASARRYGSLRAFTGPKAELKAYRFGVWFAATVGGQEWARQRAIDQAISLRVSNEGTNVAGGFVVPDEFDSTIVDLREQYGAFRQYARIVPMTSDSKKYPRRTGGLTAYFVGESTAGTESTKAWDQISLVAKKVMVLTKMTSELNEDAIINMGDDLMAEAAYALALKEDQCGFLGTGAETYGGIVGLEQKFTDLNGVDEGGGIELATGDLPSEIVLADFSGMVARLSAIGDTPNAAWYCHRTVWAHMVRLEAAAGGNTMTDLVNGARVFTFLGYPVRMCQAMHTGSAVSQALAYLGDLRLAADFGSRRGVTMAVSDSALNAFEKDELALKITERFDINVHDIGTATAAGPLVCLLGKEA